MVSLFYQNLNMLSIYIEKKKRKNQNSFLFQHVIVCYFIIKRNLFIYCVIAFMGFKIDIFFLANICHKRIMMIKYL